MGLDRSTLVDMPYEGRKDTFERNTFPGESTAGRADPVSGATLIRISNFVKSPFAEITKSSRCCVCMDGTRRISRMFILAQQQQPHSRPAFACYTFSSGTTQQYHFSSRKATNYEFTRAEQPMARLIIAHTSFFSIVSPSRVFEPNKARPFTSILI